MQQQSHMTIAHRAMYPAVGCQGCGCHGALVLHCQHILARLQNALIDEQLQRYAACARLACAGMEAVKPRSPSDPHCPGGKTVSHLAHARLVS